MSHASVTAAPPGDLHHLTDRLAARALRLALDPFAERRRGAAELAWVAGDSPCHLARARRRLRCGDNRRRSRIVARAEQLLAGAQLLADASRPPGPGPTGWTAEEKGVVTPIDAFRTFRQGAEA